jgi:hypothetical protein
MDTHLTSATDGISAWIVATVATAVLGVVLGVFGSSGVLIDPLATAYGRRGHSWCCCSLRRLPCTR